MRGTFTISATLTLALLAGTPAARAVNKSEPRPPAARKVRKQDRTVILGMEDAWRQALLTAKPDTLDGIIADDFLGIAANGTLSNKQQYLDHIRSGRFAFRTMDIDEQDVRVLGDVAIVSSKARLDASLNGSVYRGTYRYTRVYRRINGGWKAINFEATRVSGSGMTDEMQRGQPLPKKK